MADKFYITTAITYTSAKPHIGNTYEIILTDALARFKRMQGRDVFFMTGTDEHGQKVENNAAKSGVSPKEYVDFYAAEVKRIWDEMDVSYDKFIRTTDGYHEKQVQKLFKKFYDQGDIYKSEYEGMYCTPCESFWTASQLVDGKCPDCGREVKPAKESAYFFKMGKYATRLVEHIASHPEFIQPVSRKHEMLNNFLLDDEFIGKSDEELIAACKAGALKTKLQDLCVTRSTFSWGVPVSFDTKHVVYVWLDALVNYITGIGYDTENPAEQFNRYWAADVHVIGKDIIRFHTIYWPIFLMALSLPLPKQVFGHPWLLQGGDKMSKSKGNVLYADDLKSVFGLDSVRYYLLHEMPFDQDGTITWELVCERHNSDLANTLGNLVKRTVSMANKYFGGLVTDSGVEEECDESLKAVVTAARDKAAKKMDEFKVADALDEIWAIFRRANKYIDETTPWALGNRSDKKDRLQQVMYNLLEAIAAGAHLLHPFMPVSSDKIIAEIGALPRTYVQINQFGWQKEYKVTDAPETLFERLKFADLQPEINDIMDRQKPLEPVPANIEQKPLITIDDFAKVQMVVGTVTACEAVKKSKLLHETISVGGGKTLSVLSGIGKQYTAEEMVGKRVVVVTNLPAREMKGLTSEGMIVCAEAPDGTLSVISPEKDVPDGSVLA